MGIEKTKKGGPMMPTRTVSFLFLGIIAAGTILLCLPVSSRAGQPTNILTALFTSTSACCVTGLSLVNTMDYWSPFGQVVILCLIQVGGVGFMTLATLFSFVVHRTITLKERMLMSTSLNLTGLSGVVRLTKKVLIGTLICEGIGALILTCRFTATYSLPESLWQGIFTSVSAFCNAGFDLTSGSTGMSSLMPYASDGIVCGTVMLLIIIGGLGFFVWNDLVPFHRHRYSLHTRLVLITTGILILSGAILFFVFECRNPATLGGMHLPQKLLDSLFQSVTCRTAGFAVVGEGTLTGAGQGISMFLMLIGGSPGSTAGGFKTVTAAVLLLTAISVCKGSVRVSVNRRTISNRSVFNALTLLMIGLMIIFSGTFCIAAIEGPRFAFGDILFETISAMATVGLSTGITSFLSAQSQFVLILLMYLGRVGILTFGLALMSGERKVSRLTYAEEDVMIG